MVEKVDICVGVYTLAVTFRNVVDRSAWAFAGVYGPNLDRDRRILWDELAGVLSWWNMPWCIGGDFNATQFPSERSGGARLDSAVREFYNFISEQGLVDLPLVGGSFTWLISDDPPLWSRNDHFLVFPEMEAWFLGVMQKKLPLLCLDHFPIILDMGDMVRGKKLFKFENMWLKAEGLVPLVKQCWDFYELQA